ncbi:MAG: DUF3293 domain-containing protein [Pseudomonadales bacterium]|nr:DUF3293 domain-containing protein [Pseudomonadales bacterium]
MSTIDEATLLAYLRCHYRVHGAAPFTLRIGERSEALAALCRQLRCDRAAFLSAWNPHGEPRDEGQNRRAQDALQRELAARGHACIPGIGEDPGGHWRGEESVLVAGMALDEAVAMALACGQNALVWCGADARPQLILLR